MYVHMAALTTCREQARIGPWAGGEIAHGHQLAGVTVLRMTLLAQHRTWCGQQRFEIRTVRRVTVQAILAHGRVLEQEWPALLRVTAITDFVDAIGFEQRGRRRAVRIVAIDATHFAFGQRHVRTLVEFGALHLVAGEAGFVDRLSRGQAMRCEVRHRIVAIAAGELVVLVNRAVPEDALPSLMARQALRILARYRRLALVGEADDRCVVGWILHMG